MDLLETRVIQRDLRRAYATLTRAEGVYYYDDAGNRYLDGSGASAAVTAIGHGVPEGIQAMFEQAPRMAVRLRPDTRLHDRAH